MLRKWPAEGSAQFPENLRNYVYKISDFDRQHTSTVPTSHERIIIITTLLG